MVFLCIFVKINAPGTCWRLENVLENGSKLRKPVVLYCSIFYALVHRVF